MKTLFNRISNIGLLLALVIIATACPGPKPKEEEKPKDKETGMYVYELQTKAANQESFREIVKKMAGPAIDNGEFYEGDDSDLSFANVKQDIFFYQDAVNSNLSFNKGFQKYLGSFSPELPNPKEGQRLSVEFLKTNGMQPGNEKEFKLVHSGGIRADAGPKGEVIDKMLTLSYGRNLDDIPVMGSGSKIVVNVGDKGEITGLVYRWREVATSGKKAVMESEVLSEKEAAAEMFKRVVAVEFGKTAEMVVKEMKLVYYDGNGKFIQPVYGAKLMVKVMLDDKNSNEIPYMTFVPALKKTPEGLNLRVNFKESKEYIKKEENQKGDPNSKQNID